MDSPYNSIAKHEEQKYQLMALEHVTSYLLREICLILKV